MSAVEWLVPRMDVSLVSPIRIHVLANSISECMVRNYAVRDTSFNVLHLHVGDRMNAEMAVLSTTPFDALRYSGKLATDAVIRSSISSFLALLAIGILFFASLFSMMIYLIRRNPSSLLSTCAKKPFNMHRKSPSRLTAILQQQEHPSSFTLSRSHYTPAPDCHNLFSSSHPSEQYLTSRDECYEPPPYPGPPLSPSVPLANSIYYETIKTSTVSNSMSMLNAVPLPDASTSVYARTHCV